MSGPIPCDCPECQAYRASRERDTMPARAPFPADGTPVRLLHGRSLLEARSTGHGTRVGVSYLGNDPERLAAEADRLERLAVDRAAGPSAPPSGSDAEVARIVREHLGR